MYIITHVIWLNMYICCALPVGQVCHGFSVLTQKRLTLCSGHTWHLIAGPLAYKEPRLLRICSYTSIANNSNGKARSKGTHSHGKSSAKMCIAGVGRVVRGIHLAWDTKRETPNNCWLHLPAPTFWIIIECHGSSISLRMAISTVGMENQLQPGHETGARSGQVLPLFANHLVFGDFGPGWFRQYHFFRKYPHDDSNTPPNQGRTAGWLLQAHAQHRIIVSKL